MRTKTSSVIVWSLVLISLATFSCSINIDSNGGSYSGNDVRNTNYSASKVFSYQVVIDNQNKIYVEGVNGTIEVTGVSGISSVQVKGERIVRSESTEDAVDHLELLSVEIQEKSGGIFVSTRQPGNSNGRSYIVNYQIEVPVHWNVYADNVNGEIIVSEISGDSDLENVNGTVRLNELYGNTDVELVNGNVEGKVVLPLNGSCDIDIVNGGIELSIPITTSADFSASVTNGNISASNLSLENVSSSKNYLKGILNDGKGDIELSTVNGNIYVKGY